MKVVHVPFCYAPDAMGGTEIFVSHLAKDLNKIGVTSVVAAPNQDSSKYIAGGLDVYRFGITGEVADTIDLYGSGDGIAQAEFEKILDEVKPDIVHLHAWTSAVSLRLVQAAKKRSMAVVFTYHTPTVTCQRGTLRLWGDLICDGELQVRRCSACTLQGLGAPRLVATALGRLPTSVGRRLGELGLRGGVWTALRYSHLVSSRHGAFRQLVTEVDHVVAVCNWVRDLLVRNGVEAQKVLLSRQGIDWEESETSEEPCRREGEPVRIVFIGRLDPTKGLHFILDVLRKMPDLKLTLDVYGVVQGAAGIAYREAMLSKLNGDPRIRFKESLPADAVVNRLREYDFILVPSMWLETGPMVVLEAFAARVPVLGWRIGGISELVRDGVDGILVDPFSVEGWMDLLRRVAEDRQLHAELRAGIRQPRRSMDVALDMKELYQRLRIRSLH